VNREQIEERLARRRAELAAMLEQFNRQIVAQQGAIAELEAQLAELDAPDAHSNGAAVVAALEE